MTSSLRSVSLRSVEHPRFYVCRKGCVNGPDIDLAFLRLPVSGRRQPAEEERSEKSSCSLHQGADTPCSPLALVIGLGEKLVDGRAGGVGDWGRPVVDAEVAT